MFAGKLKAVTFSYDDGVKQDIKFIELLDKYGLKCTFNINSGLCAWDNRVDYNDIKETYKNHEVAVHTVTHPSLNKVVDDDHIIREIQSDILNLQKAVGYKVVGMAYPNGNPAIDERVIDLTEKAGVKYSRATTPTFNFDLQENYFDFRPTIHHNDWDNLFRLGHEFIALKPETPKLFYIWGHTYEFDFDNGYWDKIEEFLKLISGHDDIFYGTNTEVLLGYDNRKENI